MRSFRIRALLPDLAAALVLIGLPLLVFWQVWAPNPADRVMFGGDILMGAYPTRVFVHRLFALGQQPAWNPYQLGGMPLWGDIQVAPYYLPNYLLDVLYRGRELTFLAVEMLVIAHYMLGGLLLYAFVRNLKVGPAAALIGAIAFEFNGFFVGHRGHYNMLGVVAWLPGVLWLLDRAWQARAPRAALAWSVMAGLALSQLVMAGHPQLALYCSVMLAAYAGYRWAEDLRRAERSRALRWLRVPVLLGIAGTLAGGIAAITLLPAMELLSRSLRSEPTYSFAAQYSLLPRNLIGLLAPEFLGWGVTEFRIYAGILTLVLAAACFVPERGIRERRFFALATVLALVLALGGFTIVHSLIYRFVPGFDSVRVSSRAFYLANLSLAVLAAFGAEALLATLKAGERRRLRQLVKALAGLLAVAALFGAGLYVFLVRSYAAVGEDFFFSENLFSREPSADAFTLLTQTANGWLLFVLLFGASVALLWARSSGRLAGRAFAIASGVLMFVDVASYAPYHDTVAGDPETARFTVKQYATTLLDQPWQVTDQQQLIDAVSQLPDGVRVDNTAEVLPDNYSAVYRAAFATGYNILDLEERFKLLTQWPTLSATRRHDLLSVGYVLTAADAEDPPEPDATLVLANSQGKLWQRAQQPRYAQFSTSARPASTSITINGLLSRADQSLDAQPTIALDDGPLGETLARLWPETVDPALRAIGGTGVTSPVDISVLSGGPIKYSAVIVDGQTVTPEQRGIVLALVDPDSGKVLASDGFDTYMSPAESARLAATINAAPAGTIVALATYDEGTAKLDAGARAAIASLGATTDLANQVGAAYALIGVKDSAPGTALERIGTEAVVVDVGVGALPPTADAAFTSRIVSYAPERISLLVQNSARGVFAVSEAVFPGWVAYVDGIETPILRVNGLQRGVILPPSLAGQAHEVTFVYEPLSARLGGAISLLTTAAAISLLVALLVLDALPLWKRLGVEPAAHAT